MTVVIIHHVVTLWGFTFGSIEKQRRLIKNIDVVIEGRW
jgi:hypothetical protein